MCAQQEGRAESPYCEIGDSHGLAPATGNAILRGGLTESGKRIVTTHTFIYTLIYTNCVERIAGNGSRRKRETAEGTLRVEVPGTKGKRKWVAKTVHGGPPWVK